jgi:predicted nucleic acid-binding protein
VTTALDSNVLIAFWNEDDELNLEASKALQGAAEAGELVISPPVYVEIRSIRDRDEAKIEYFLEKTEIHVDWQLEERIWREAAQASHEYVKRRKGAILSPRRITADFVIGAHAMVRDYPLLTLDKRTFRVAFPSLKMARGSF